MIITGQWGSTLTLNKPEIKQQPRSREATKKSKSLYMGFSFFCLPSRLRGFVAVWILILGPALVFAGEEKLVFLPPQPAFEKLIADPREPHDGIQIQSGSIPYEGDIGSAIELLQWRPADGSLWGFGILGAASIGLGTADPDAYPKRLVYEGGVLNYNLFPELVSDWQLGAYFSQSSGAISHRLEYTHVSSHLGDELFDYVPRFIYTRESFRYILSFQPSENARLYAGAGYSGHIDPAEKPFFLHAGAELYTNPFEFLFHTAGKGYLGYDMKLKAEAGGVFNQALQLGLQWKWKKESRQAVRLAVLYYNGNSEFGEFYRQKDEHWGFGIFFDP